MKNIMAVRKEKPPIETPAIAAAEILEPDGGGSVAEVGIDESEVEDRDEDRGAKAEDSGTGLWQSKTGVSPFRANPSIGCAYACAAGYKISMS